MEEERKTKPKKQYKDPRAAAPKQERPRKREPVVGEAEEKEHLPADAEVKPKPKKQKMIASSDRTVRESTKVQTMLQKEEIKVSILLASIIPLTFPRCERKSRAERTRSASGGSPRRQRFCERPRRRSASIRNRFIRYASGRKRKKLAGKSKAR